jgi:hypothetical protein
MSPLAKSATVTVSPPTTAAVVNPPDTISRIDIGGVPADVYNYFNVPLNSSEKEVSKLKLIADWAKEGNETMGDALLKIRSLETHLGSPNGMEKRYQKIWQYCKMDMYSKELDKKKEALRRRF